MSQEYAPKPRTQEDAPKPRTLVLCFDGTTNQFSAENTNVVRFFSFLRKDNEGEQLCYYNPGVGTYFNPGVVSPLFEWGARYMDYAVAWYLDEHVMDGYKFVMQNYRDGDKICLFGFSRGAYTARALAGFLHKIGVLPRDNQEQIPLAYRLYRRTDSAGLLLSKGYKETYCREVNIEFIGVWDTVSSVGIIAGKTLPFVASNTAIKTFRHALSLDERRCKFEPNLYHKPAPDSAGAKRDPEHSSVVLQKNGDGQQPSNQRLSDKLRLRKPNAYSPEEEINAPCDALEVWFSGCHSDIGGGSVPNGTLHSLENITLRWMVRQVVASRCGIQFDEAALAQSYINPIVPPVGPSTSAGPDVDIADASQPLDNQLVKNPLWWILEILPLTFAWQDVKGAWHKTIRINAGRPRTIYTHRPKFHTTVKTRIDDKALKYRPAARWEGQVEYVD